MGSPTITPVILCGGAGTRLWPLSRRSFPKQFSGLTGGQSLFQQAALRARGVGFADPVIVTAEPFRFVVADQLVACGVEPRAVLLEPTPCNTAPSVLSAAAHLSDDGSDTLMLVLPSDHAIPDANAFQGAIKAAAPAALEGRIVTFGIMPDRPETGYGYLEPAGPLGSGPVPLRRFVEKPNAETAQRFVDQGLLWNSGALLCRPADLIKSAKAQSPADEIAAKTAQAVARARPDLGFLRLDPQAWADMPALSNDVAIMEGAETLSVMPFDGLWSDLGDWDAVQRAGARDNQGNSVSDKAMAVDCHNSLLLSGAEGVALVGLGLENLIAVATADAVLVAHRDRAQEVSGVVEYLRGKGAAQADAFPTDHRPWGQFETLAQGARFQVKRIVVKPGGILSLQSHVHRAEHWIVVQGTAQVTLGDETRQITENQSVYVPLGAKHRLENPGKCDVILIEVQTGTYLGEDDITRYEDAYARD